MFIENDHGFEFQDENTIVFFGKKNCTLDDLRKAYPHYEFRLVKQTHSRIVIPSVKNSAEIEADAHFTDERNVGLVIRTADCLPILISSAQKNFVAAIHAGWRGVQNQITLETLKMVPQAQDLKIYIGPHILQESFEVQSDVKDLLLKSAYDVSADTVKTQNDRYLINLQNIVLSQVKQVAPQAQIQTLYLDTFKNSQFNSFRSNQTSQRNHSFIAQKTSPV